MISKNLAKIKENFTKENSPYPPLIKGAYKVVIKRKKVVIWAFVFKVAISAVIAVMAFMGGNQQAEAAFGLSEKNKQVKAENGKTVYYLDHVRKMKKAYPSAAAYLSYGNKWQDVKVVKQKDLDKWPDARLVKADGSPSVYYINGNKKTAVQSEKDFRDFGFDWKKVVKINKTDLDSYKLVSYREAGLSFAIANNFAGALIADFDVTNPKSGYLPLDSRKNLIAAYNFYAPERREEIKWLVLNFSGVFNSSAISKIYLADENGYEIDVPATVNGKTAVFNLTNSPVKIEKGQERKIKVYADLKNYSNFEGQTFRVNILKASDIDSSAPVQAAFPIMGSEFKFANGDSLGKAKIEEVSINKNDLLMGTNAQVVGKFKISETTGREGLIIQSLKFHNVGNAGKADIKNFELRDNTHKVIAKSEIGDDNKILFRIKDYKIKERRGGEFYILADVTGGAGKVVDLNIYDAEFTGALSGFGLLMDKTVVSDKITISRNKLGITSKPLAVKNLKLGEDEAIIANFQIRPNQAIYLDKINLNIDKGNSPDLAGPVYLIDETGNVLSSMNFTREDFELSFNGQKLSREKEFNFFIIGRVKDEAVDGHYYKVNLKKISYRTAAGECLEDNFNLSGQVLRIKKSNIYIFPNQKDAEVVYTKGQKNVKVASFILEVSGSDEVSISNLTLLRSGSSSPILYEKGFSNVKAFINGSKGKVIEKPFSDRLFFEGFKTNLKPGSRVEVKVYADTESDLAADEVKLALTGIGAVNKSSGITTDITGLNTESRKVAFGEISVQFTPVAGGTIVAGAKDNIAGSFTAANLGKEEIKLRAIIINATGNGFSNSLGFKNLSIREKITNKKIGSLARPLAGSNKITLNSFTLKAGQTADFNVNIDAEEDIPATPFEISFKELEVEGKKSAIKLSVAGGPAGMVVIKEYENPINPGTSTTTPPTVTPTIFQLSWPTSAHSVSYGFHDAKYPYRNIAEHEGIDIITGQGNTVRASAAGTVSMAQMAINLDEYSYIVIDHGNGWQTVYGHLSDVSVKIGDTVKTGTKIGLSGGKPGTLGAGKYSSGPHLHFELRQNGTAINPQQYLK